MTFFRTALFLPQTIAGVVVAQAFVWFYALDGPFNRFLTLIGLGSITRGWLGDFDWALTFVGTIGTWVTFGLCMVLFIAGAQKISTSLYDAARVDGAGAVREFFAVTLPGPAQRARGRVRADDDQRAAQLRPDLQRHERRPGQRDLRARAARLPERVPVQQGRLLVRRSR